MSFLFGGVRGRSDPDLAAANRRSRLHLARDVNDQRTLAAQAENPLRRGSHWTWFIAAAVALTVLALVNRGGTDVELAADCTSPRIAVGTAEVTAGEPLHFRLAGPDRTRYVVTLDGAPVQGDAGSLVSYTQTDAGPALELPQCLSPTLVVAAPAGNGPHELGLFRLAADGTPARVATTSVTVVGGR